MSKQKIITENIRDGEMYAGLILGKDGASDYHIFLQPGDVADVTWQAAMNWAKEVGADLPTRCEQALLFANLKEQFQPCEYWSVEQHGPSSADAWYQYFFNGFQGYNQKSHEGRARAVRRLQISEHQENQ